MHKLNIQMIGPRIDSLANGVGVATDGLAHALHNSGHNVTMHLIEPVHAEIAGIPYKQITYPPFPIAKKFGYNRSIVSSLQKQCQTADILHANSLWMYINMAPAWVELPPQCKLIVSPHGTLAKPALKRASLFKKILLQMGQKEVLLKAAAIHVTSSAEAQAVRDFGIDTPIAHIPHGVTIPDLDKNIIKENRVLYLGRIHPIKGLENLIEGWALCGDKVAEWELILAGPDENRYADKLRALIIEKKMTNVKLHDAVYGEEKNRLLQSSRLFVLPSFTENFGYSVPEALAAEVPVIAAKGTPWQKLKEKSCGWWVENDVDALTSVLIEALSQPTEVLAGMGKKGRCWIEEDFSWSGISEKMAELYLWACTDGQMPTFVEGVK
jgi:glycosyltransferase involved in cell wall biosynthesis